jgi:hypothetical protein
VDTQQRRARGIGVVATDDVHGNDVSGAVVPEQQPEQQRTPTQTTTDTHKSANNNGHPQIRIFLQVIGHFSD